MSGHSKWSQIKRQKGTADVKRGAAFTKLANAISVAVREGGKDPVHNVRLRLAIDKARSLNMPKDNIERAVKRGAGELEGQRIEEASFEGYGPEGVAVIVDTITDNRNRTAAEVRKAFHDHGGTLGTVNSVRWMFDRRGVLTVASPHDRPTVELAAIDAGAIDVEESDGDVIVMTEPTDLTKVRTALERAGHTITSGELALVPKSMVVPTPAATVRVRELLTTLDDLQDVTHVATNAEI